MTNHDPTPVVPIVPSGVDTRGAFDLSAFGPLHNEHSGEEEQTALEQRLNDARTAYVEHLTPKRIVGPWKNNSFFNDI